MINRIYIGGLGAQFLGKNKLMQYIKYQRFIPCVHRAAEKLKHGSAAPMINVYGRGK